MRLITLYAHSGQFLSLIYLHLLPAYFFTTLRDLTCSVCNIITFSFIGKEFHHNILCKPPGRQVVYCHRTEPESQAYSATGRTAHPTGNGGAPLPDGNTNPFFFSPVPFSSSCLFTVTSWRTPAGAGQVSPYKKD